MKKFILPPLTLFIVCASLHGQTAHNATNWNALFTTIKTGNKTSIHADMQWRSTHKLKHTQSYLIRGGLNYHLNKKATATAGYAYINKRQETGNGSIYTPEHRIWEQLTLFHTVKEIITISHRFRLEHRFFQNSRTVSGSAIENHWVTTHRLRYFIRNILPISKTENFHSGFFAALQNEVFVNIGKNEYTNGSFFDQNRIYIASGYRINKRTDLELGYMNQFNNGRNSTAMSNHILQVAGYLRL